MLDDDQTLQVAAAGSIAFASGWLVAPKPMGKTFFEDSCPKEETYRYPGLALGGLGATLATMAAADDLKSAKKNALKVTGGLYLAAAGMNLYHANSGYTKKDVTVASAAVQAALGGWCLYRGFKDE